YHQAVAGTAKVGCNLFGPLHRCIHRVRPTDRIVIVGSWPAQLINHRQQKRNALLDAVGGSANLVCRALKGAFGARAIVAHHEMTKVLSSCPDCSTASSKRPILKSACDRAPA